MWCSNTSCGVKGTGSFCQQCGARMVKFRSSGTEEKICCSNPSCGYEGTGNFCQQCGAKMIKYRTVTCSGKLEDGSPCNAELVPSKNFCSNCGAEVDKSLFFIRPTKTICQKCGTELEKGSSFCSHCGQKQSKQDEKGERKAKVKADINFMSSSSRGFCRKRRNAKETDEKEEKKELMMKQNNL